MANTDSRLVPPVAEPQHLVSDLRWAAGVLSRPGDLPPETREEIAAVCRLAADVLVERGGVK